MTIVLVILTKQFGGERALFVVEMRSIVTLLMIVEALDSRQVTIFPFISSKGTKRGILKEERGKANLFDRRSARTLMSDDVKLWLRTETRICSNSGHNFTRNVQQ